MKILIVCQYFYPERFRVNDICFELVKRGHEVTVLTGLPNYPSGVVDKSYKKIRIESINGVKVVRSWLIGRGTSTKQLFINYITFALSSMLTAIKLNGPFDKIVVYQLSPVTMVLPAILAKKKFKIPLIIYTHDLWPESIASGGITSKGLIYRLVKKLSIFIYKQADEIWLSSKMFKTYFQDYLTINRPLYHLPVYAESLFEGITTRQREGELNLVFAGNIGEMQSVETIIMAANELKNNCFIKFHIIGDGSSKKKCERLSHDLDLKNVLFYGSFPVEEMPRFYEMADAFLITLKNNQSISYTLPNKVQSYMAASKPIIGAINGETAEVIKEANNGLIAQAENYKGLSELILQFRNYTNEEKESLSINSKKYYDKNFSKKVYFEKLNFILSTKKE